MKNSFNSTLKTSVAAIALTLVAGAASATTVTMSERYLQPVFTNGNFGLSTGVNAGVREVTIDKVTAFVFCIEPTQTMVSSTDYIAKSLSIKQSVQNLYNSSYASIMSGFNANKASATNVAAFQLALWELQNDDGNLATGALKFTSKSTMNQATVLEAQSLLSAASSYHGANLYKYTSLVSATSQDLLQVSAVPEPETYAMLLAGLGLIGFMARRRKAA